ncbi:hypothetical protein JKP88DRAFT_321439 [Tribonema minus]|uniref:Uncharacterized protein n=1 Tax=Tribonema minus TaxID=303371 RepID=A0A835Z1G1_9STRA|nr:hypothetical protein JKP88DRAFT_321439 [Tribonema minus]
MDPADAATCSVVLSEWLKAPELSHLAMASKITLRICESGELLLPLANNSPALLAFLEHHFKGRHTWGSVLSGLGARCHTGLRSPVSPALAINEAHNSSSRLAFLYSPAQISGAWVNTHHVPRVATAIHDRSPFPEALRIASVWWLDLRLAPAPLPPPGRYTVAWALCLRAPSVSDFYAHSTWVSVNGERVAKPASPTPALPRRRRSIPPGLISGHGHGLGGGDIGGGSGGGGGGSGGGGSGGGSGDHPTEYPHYCVEPVCEVTLGAGDALEAGFTDTNARTYKGGVTVLYLVLQPV